MSRSARHRLALGAGALALVFATALAGCAHAPVATIAPEAAAARARLALLPLENLSGHAEYGDRFTRLAWATLGRDGRYTLVDPGQVDGAMVDLRIRSTGVLTRDQLLRMAARLRVRWLLLGSLLEAGAVRTPDGDVPTFSLVLRLVDGESGEVVWSDLRTRTGEDHETVFGWGRETSLEKLAEAATRDLVAAFVIPTSVTPDSTKTPEGRP